jgi:hypothetical protein
MGGGVEGGGRREGKLTVFRSLESKKRDQSRAIREKEQRLAAAFTATRGVPAGRSTSSLGLVRMPRATDK